MGSNSGRAAWRNDAFQRRALAVAIGGAVALAFSGGAFAQSVNGAISGMAPTASGATIQITNDAGYNRTVPIGPSGKYSVTLPVGTYTVRLLQNGQVVKTRTGVTAVSGGNADVDFTSSSNEPQTLSAVTVTANAIPPIDFSTSNQVTTITSQQLKTLPLGRSAENIALLAPGVTSAAPTLSSGPLGNALVIFGGATTAENAYYIDGMNTTDMLNGQGGVSLPYGSIEQQQTFTAGYGAKYGRSIGGVINQIGKSGSNTWHFGGQAEWNPSDLRQSYKPWFYRNPLSTTPGQEKGDIYEQRNNNKVQENVFDAYLSGPIVKDHLFFFLSAEQDIEHSIGTASVNSKTQSSNTWHMPKLYAKLNWNINSSNFATLTAVQNSEKFWQSNWNFDPATQERTGFLNLGNTTKTSFRTWVFNYTSYLTDNLTLHAMFGKTHGEYYTEQPAYAGFDPSLPNILSSGTAGSTGFAFENPALVPNGPVHSSNLNTTMADPAHTDSITSYRVDLSYKLGNHDIEGGIDNVTTWDHDDGTIMTGPGYGWLYQQVADPNANIEGFNPGVPPFVGAPNSVPNGTCNVGGKTLGCVVSKYIFTNAADLRVAQRAEYLQDNWQVTPDLLLQLGVRNDSYVNYNNAGEPYIRETKPQWQPRLGFVWNVNGNNTTKVFGNAGRYYLALPAQPALRAGGGSLFTQQYYTYTGINQATGEPTGLTAIPQNNGGRPGGVSANNEYGQAEDPRLVAATNVGAEYSDNFVLGVNQQFNWLGTKWVAGATGVYQDMSRIVDDWDDMGNGPGGLPGPQGQTTGVCAAAIAQGVAFPGGVAQCQSFQNGSVLVNPGTNQTVLVQDPSGAFHQVKITPADQGFEKGPTRKYYGLTLSLTHPWDGKWFGKIEYTFARNWGNEEGPVDSVIGQSGSSVAITEAWDYWTDMQNSYGLLPNDQKHQLKIYGAYAITPEWMVGANINISSGHPFVCL
ncbi:MAG TPA: TonB-dependent receptor plug domain-containing protein, partial [Rhodanobacteraceae bacterium]